MSHRTDARVYFLGLFIFASLPNNLKIFIFSCVWGVGCLLEVGGDGVGIFFFWLVVFASLPCFLYPPHLCLKLSAVKSIYMPLNELHISHCNI